LKAPEIYDFDTVKSKAISVLNYVMKIYGGAGIKLKVLLTFTKDREEWSVLHSYYSTWSARDSIPTG
jgi:hypothetical protein